MFKVPKILAEKGPEMSQDFSFSHGLHMYICQRSRWVHELPPPGESCTMRLTQARRRTTTSQRPDTSRHGARARGHAYCVCMQYTHTAQTGREFAQGVAVITRQS